MTTEIVYLENTKIMGFFSYEYIEERLLEYEIAAEEYCELIQKDEVILYAILAYDPETEECLSADTMLLRMNYSDYLSLVMKLSSDVRLFIKKKY